MARTIDAAFYRELEDYFYLLTQQRQSKLQDKVMVATGIQAKSFDANRVGPTEAYQVTAANMDTLLIDQPHSRRRMSLVPYAWAAMLDTFDEAFMLTSPESEYTANCVAAINRQKDKVIATQAIGTAVSVAANDDVAAGYSNISLPTAGGSLAIGQVIVNGGTGFTLTKIQQAGEILDENEFPSEDRYIAWSPVAKMQLLKTTQVQSIDYNTVKALVNGTIDSFYGFKFITFGNRNPGSAALAKTGNIRSCIVWHKSAIKAGFGRIQEINVSQRHDKNDNWQVLGKVIVGAVRLDELGVVQLDIDESV